MNNMVVDIKKVYDDSVSDEEYIKKYYRGGQNNKGIFKYDVIADRLILKEKLLKKKGKHSIIRFCKNPFKSVRWLSDSYITKDYKLLSKTKTKKERQDFINYMPPIEGERIPSIRDRGRFEISRIMVKRVQSLRNKGWTENPNRIDSNTINPKGKIDRLSKLQPTPKLTK